ncbi:hypothetical protein NQ315_008650 [Exocentrus adspersus]|uniref:Myb-like domain-containing protein n=1 Tax=Exocentrus adspersus TaxID=1586481 RepID=A0AAV8W791_9CUCU|nr:hypothetical protein NQ315_008650 [Exocentrus adspersus]
MEPLEIYDAVNNKVLRVYVSTEVAEKCRTDTDFAQDLFNKIQDENIEEGSHVEVETIKVEDAEDGEFVEQTTIRHQSTNGNDCSMEERTDREIWSQQETLKLITVYKKYQNAFKEHKVQKVVWAMIAAELSQYSIFKSPAKCAKKWMNMLRTYKIAIEKPNQPTRFQFYQEMKDIINNTEASVSDSELDEKRDSAMDNFVDIKDPFSEESPEKESWTRYETLKLLKAFQMFKHMKQSFSKEKHFLLAKDDICKPYKKCAVKWKNLLRTYKKSLQRSDLPKRFQYFQEVNDVLNDTELEISDDVRFLDDVEKSDDPEHFKFILEEVDQDSSKDPITWAADETLKFIDVYKKYKSTYENCVSKKYMWTMLSIELAKQGVHRSADKLENKWKSLMRSYRNSAARGEWSRFYFYEEMADALRQTEGSADIKTNIDSDDEAPVDNIKTSGSFDHSYSENTGVEQIIIETEPKSSNDSEPSWTATQISSLLAAYANCKKKINQDKDLKLWEEVSKELLSRGIHKSSENCEKKWKKMVNLYKIQKLSKSSADRFPFFQEIDNILSDEVADDSDSKYNISHLKKCHCNEKKSLDKQERHIERMQMLKRKLDLEERKIEAFEFYVKHLKTD